MIGTVEERRAVLDGLYPTWEKHTLWTRFQESVQRFQDRPYLMLETETYSYRETMEHVEALAQSLYALGVRAESHVAVLLPNSSACVFLIYALAKLGAVKIPVNMAISRTELVHVLNQADVEYLITRYILDDEILAQLPRLKKIVLQESDSLCSSERYMTWKCFEAQAQAVSAREVDELSARSQDPDGLCDIMFTSGSTNESKGVMLTHDMLLRSAFANCYTRCFEIGRRIYAPLPLFHAYTYVEGVIALQYVGGCMVMSESKFNPCNALQIMRDFRVNDMLLIGSLVIKMLLDGKPKPEDYPDLHAGYWCVTTPDWIWDGARAAFGFQDITTGMGMTELSSSGVMTTPDAPLDYVMKYDGQPKRAGCAGLPEYQGNLLSIKICDPDTGADLPPDTEGEIYYRGVVVTKGYYRNEEATQKAYTADGWFRSGDLGRMTADGYLKFVGRKNDMYKINAENVSPLFLDSVIGRCPLVNAVETVGVFHSRYGEVGVAFIDAKDTSDAARAEIEIYCRDNLARFQVPKYYFYSDSDTWPKTGTGKMSKALLRKLAVQLITAQDEQL